MNKKEFFLIELGSHRLLKELQDLVLVYLYVEELYKSMEEEYGLYLKLERVPASILLFLCGKDKTKSNNT